MSTLVQAGEAASNMRSRLEPVQSFVNPPVHVPPMPMPIFLQPNMFLRCAMPFSAASPDSLRQFYREGLPQMRVTPLAQLK